MKIEIWSDVVCPFCYIGKRCFEKVLSKFEHKEQVEVIWKSFQLNPDLKQKPGQNLYQYMAEHKGWTEEYAKGAVQHVNSIAQAEGLTFDFDRSIPANTFDAHRLVHLANSRQLQATAEERLFHAHFMEGKDVGNRDTLMELGREIGLEDRDLTTLFGSSAYSTEVATDIREAQQLGISGVPFFVINRQFGISGAQPEDVFIKSLEKAWTEELKSAAKA